MRDYVLLYVNGSRHEVRGADAWQTLSDYLRQTRRLTGTKVVCAEGDCGSCTVMIGRPCADSDQELAYTTVTSCIQLVAQLDGAHVITVEGLGTTAALHPVQQMMIEHHGAQCGYCTPGMVVSLCSLLAGRTQAPSRQETTRALVGNLCRCTGYDSILHAASQVDCSQVKSLAAVYASPEMQAELKQATSETVQITDGARHLLKPATLAEALRFRQQFPQAAILAGGTDLGVVWNKGKRELQSILCIGQVPELREVNQSLNSLVLGATTTLTSLETMAATHLPEFARLLERFGSPLIKNAGTIGGNLANGSPIGDSLPGLLVLQAAVELASSAGTRQVNLNDFYTGYRQNVMQPEELLTQVVIPLPEPDDLFLVEKISKRRDLDISSFTAAMWMQLDGKRIRDVRLAYGGVAATVVRLTKTEQFLIGKEIDEATFQAGGKIARQEIKPISDVRGSAEYRWLLAENVLVKFGRRARQVKQLVHA